MLARHGLCALALVSLATACVDDRVGYVQQPLVTEAYCQANVVGVGSVPVETDYVPSVVSCENGAASFEALKAQAIAARSYLYYRMESAGEIQDGTGDQVYSCSRAPNADHMRAASETAGQVLAYRGTQVAAFYVAGAFGDPPGCVGGPSDPTNTEQFVTYNEGKSGDDLEQTTLGLVDPSNYANRGCMSQNGSDCLSDDGAGHEEIIRYYYGADIELIQIYGPCVPGAAPDAGVPSDAGDDGGDEGGCSAVGGGTSAPLWPALWAVVALLARARRRVS